MSTFPHLKDTESVRSEAADQYGGLSDAAAFTNFHKANIDPNVEAVALKRLNVPETEKVLADLEGVQSKVDAQWGDGTYRVIDAAVRGDGLSLIVEDADGRRFHKVLPYTDRYRAIAHSPEEAAARANIEAEAAKSRLGVEMRAEVARLVAQAEAKIREDLSKEYADRAASVVEDRDEAIEEAAKEADKAEEKANDTGSGSGRTGSRSSSAKFPSKHDELDALAKANNVEFPKGRVNVAEKQALLKKAGVKPPEE